MIPAPEDAFSMHGTTNLDLPNEMALWQTGTDPVV